MQAWNVARASATTGDVVTQDLGPADETMQAAQLAYAATSTTTSAGSTSSQTPAVPINWAEVSYLTGVAQNGSLTSNSYWGYNGETARRWMNGTSATSEPAGGAGGTVTYYFDAASNWSAAERGSFVSGLDLWSAVANIQFAQASSAAAADCVISRGTDGSAYCSTPAYSGSGSSVGRIAGDSAGAQYQSEISIDTSQVSWSQLSSFSSVGGYGISTIVHEEGHLLGLGHAGPYNGNVDPATQQNSAFDTRLWSTMSYIQPDTTSAKYYTSYPVTGTNWGYTSDYYYRAPYTWMPLDIIAAQQLYGVASNTPLSGGQVFGFNCNIAASSGIRSYFDFTIDTSPVITLYDIGLNNTLDLSGYNQNSVVDLRDGHFSSVAGLIDNIAIAYNTRIDNAVGGGGSDTFQVNAYNDVINGGAGADTVTFLGNRADYAITRSNTGVVTVADSNTSRGGTDQLTNVETLRFADQSVATSSIAVAAPASSLFGTTTTSQSSPGGQIYDLYDGLLGRAPSPLELEALTASLQSGTSLHDIAHGLLASSEFTTRFGSYTQLSDSAFVQTLYQTALHRSAEPAGLQAWDNALANGTSREDVALGITLSGEHQVRLQGTFNAGVFVPDSADTSIARLYYGLLDRAPDAGGLATWESAAAHGTSLQSIAQGFIASGEYVQRHGQQSDSQFVTALYEGALGREPEGAGLTGWQSLLSQGTPRASVALGIVESGEAQNHLVGNIEVGWQLA